MWAKAVHIIIVVALGIGHLIAQQYNFTNYGLKEGLSQSQVLNIHQDKYGFMWFGTNGGGVNRLDGHKFQHLTTADGLLSNVVFSIENGLEDDLIFGTDRGVNIYKNGKIETIPYQNSFFDIRTFCIVKHPTDGLYLGTANGLFLYDGKQIKGPLFQYQLEEPRVFTLYLEGDKLWVGTFGNGLFCINKDQSINHYNTKNGLSHNYVFSISKNPNNGLIIAGTPIAFNSIDNNAVRTHRFNDSIATLSFHKILHDTFGNTWYGTEFGLYKINATDTTIYGLKNGLCSNKVWDLFQDREGNIWIGSDEGGLSLYTQNTELFSTYNSTQGLANPMIDAVFQDSKNNIWLGTSMGVFKGDGSKKQIPHFQRVKADNNNNAIARGTGSFIEDKNGQLWMGTTLQNIGLFCYDGKNFKEYNSSNSKLPENGINALKSYKNGFLICGKKILTYWDGADFEIIVEVGSNIFDAFPKNNGDIWLATDEGLQILSKGKLSKIGVKYGLVNDRVRSICADKWGVIWLATNKGLFHLKDDRFVNISENQGLVSNTVYALTIDKNNQLYLGTNQGINRIDLQTYHQKDSLIIKKYSSEEGFFPIECNHNAMMCTPDNKILIGTVDGLSIFNPESEVTNTIPPLIYLVDIKKNFKTFDWSPYTTSYNKLYQTPENLKLPYHINHLSFEFITPYFFQSKDIAYSYRLFPLEKQWSLPNKNVEISYPLIPPGKYEFEVKSLNNNGVESAVVVKIPIQIHPPWYQTWWFYITLFVLVVIIIVSYVKYREIKHKELNARLKNLVRKRTEEIRNEKEKVEQINQEVIEKNQIIETKNKDITDSINYAQRIQQSILMSTEERLKILPESFVFFRPKDIVSGDFYWILKDEENIYFSSCDCTGHGVPGAFMSMISHALLNEVVFEKKAENPGIILDEVRSGIIQSLKQNISGSKDGMDSTICSLNRSKNELLFSGANNPLYLVRKEDKLEISIEGLLQIIEPNISDYGMHLFEIKGDKQPVGIFAGGNTPFTTVEVKIKPGDQIYLSTDGFPDQFGGPKGKKFKYKPFKILLLSLHEKPMSQQQKTLESAIEEWMMGGAYEQVDDVCVVGVKI